MSLEAWKSIFEITGVVLLFLTFLSGAGVLFTSTRINARQAEQLRQFEKGLTAAKTELGNQQERAARAEGDAAEAKSTAAKANDRTLSLETEAATAKERAAKAEKELLELQQKFANRTLSDEQLKAIAAELKRFSGQEYGVFAVGWRPEVTSLAGRIMEALNLSGWKFTQNEGFIQDFVGLNVNVQSAADTRTKEAAAALVAALRSQGIASNIGWYIDAKTPNKINIAIGAKN